MPMLVFWTLLWSFTLQTQESYSVSNMEFYSRIKGDLEKLCPKADICNTSAEAPAYMPNGAIDPLGGVSCCQGCSCHPDCWENINCCFPDESNGTDRATTMECVYIQTGQPEDTWPEEVLAYRMVVSAPEGGCRPQTSFSTVRSEDMNFSCNNESLTPWGSLFPVYSKKEDKIYKNQLCADCHGVSDGETFHPMLVCDKFTNSGPIPLSEYMQFLEKDSKVSNCFVTFRFTDNAVLQDKNCFADYISTCEVRKDGEYFQIPSLINLTVQETIEACESGLRSPVWTKFNIYKNIFCVICNKGFMSHPKSCYGFGLRGIESSKLSLLLDVTMFQLNNNKGKIQARPPQACMLNDDKKAYESCRYILCPSGQIRDHHGRCVFPMKRWYEDHFMVFLKLKYFAETKNVVSLFLDGTVSAKQIFDALAKGNPWSHHWSLLYLYHNIESDGSVKGDPLIIVALICSINKPSVLIGDIQQNIIKMWSVVLNGTTSQFQQSFLEYTIASTKPHGTFIPSWLKVSSNASLLDKVSAPHLWRIGNSKPISALPYFLTKLHTCEQISLDDAEYKLMAENHILISNLTTRVLFDSEFDMVTDIDGKVAPRVCVSDTFLQRKDQVNGFCPEKQTGLVLSLAFLVLCVIKVL